MSVQFHASTVLAGALALDMIEAARRAHSLTSAKAHKLRGEVLRDAHTKYMGMLKSAGEAADDLHKACAALLEEIKVERAAEVKFKREKREKAIADREAIQAMLAAAAA